ncbi:hypothetical protein BZA70DRAFT_284798 [Myxozyma melibiosi]|uniref:Translation initiation factor IF-2, mitochondrial n=1 Tax=Myxozyma melibiosi TaxID=54550 RepID=A0ABR1EYP8_9ASCO
MDTENMSFDDRLTQATTDTAAVNTRGLGYEHFFRDRPRRAQSNSRPMRSGAMNMQLSHEREENVDLDYLSTETEDYLGGSRRSEQDERRRMLERDRERSEMMKERAREKRQAKEGSRGRDKPLQNATDDAELTIADIQEPEIVPRTVEKKKPKQEKKETQDDWDVRRLVVPPTISVQKLATLIKVTPMLLRNVMRNLGYDNLAFDYILDFENAALICQEFGFEAKEGKNIDIFAQPLPLDTETLPTRPPFVTIMGHVDHGKTTILDYLRKSAIVEGEHGGITQHIGAFSVPTQSNDKTITFLDTPGHSAFLKMRQRGANVTDIVILVVAADDSVMPQTIEAIKHARNAKVPIIVAVNKIDKPNVNVNKVYEDLAVQGVIVEEYGGDTQAIKVSGLTGQGIDELEEAILAQAEILDLRAPVNGKVEGWVVESEVIKGRGTVATVVVRRGQLVKGLALVAGTAYCRVKALRDENGRMMPFAGPGFPVEVEGWKELPEAGDEVLEAADEKHARLVAEFRAENEVQRVLLDDLNELNDRRQQDRDNYSQRLEHERTTMTNKARQKRRRTQTFLVDQNEDGDVKYRNFIIKCDVMGSVEAIIDSISTIGNDVAKVRVVHPESDLGPPTASDVALAKTAGADIICFNVKPDREIKALAAREGVKLVTHNVIYHLIEDVTSRTAELLPPINVKKTVAEAEIRMKFDVTAKNGQIVSIAGCRVISGTAKRTLNVSVMRGDEEFYDGTLEAMKQGKKDASEVQNGSECGIMFKDFRTFESGDIVRFYTLTQTKAYL